MLKHKTYKYSYQPIINGDTLFLKQKPLQLVSIQSTFLLIGVPYKTGVQLNIENKSF